jgi:hypothetical protein
MSLQYKYRHKSISLDAQSERCRWRG